MSTRIVDALDLISDARQQVATCFDDFVGLRPKRPSHEDFWKPVTDGIADVWRSVGDDLNWAINEFASTQDK